MNPESGTNFQDWEPVVLKKRTIPVKNQNTPKKEDDDTITVKTIGRELKVALQQARLNKKMSQKDVATKMNVKPNDIMNYENGKAVPNNAFISKLEKLYGTKLPRATVKKLKNDK
ncbi:hypothetical protein CL656_06210 [bacterium]|nr:hypothetical protein [bacterium]|tara:strand:+ start:709 stop:1053 length:345 start_codon:yes stop_codon:yes gene_type:complete